MNNHQFIFSIKPIIGIRSYNNTHAHSYLFRTTNLGNSTHSTLFSVSPYNKLAPVTLSTKYNMNNPISNSSILIKAFYTSPNPYQYSELFKNNYTISQKIPHEQLTLPPKSNEPFSTNQRTNENLIMIEKYLFIYNYSIGLSKLFHTDIAGIHVFNQLANAFKNPYNSIIHPSQQNNTTHHTNPKHYTK